MTKQRWTRGFLGNMDVLFLNKEDRKGKETEIAFEKKHLKAYIKGYERFTFGTHTVTDAYGRDIQEPTWHTVKQKLEQI